MQSRAQATMAFEEDEPVLTGPRADIHAGSGSGPSSVSVLFGSTASPSSGAAAAALVSGFPTCTSPPPPLLTGYAGLLLAA